MPLETDPPPSNATSSSRDWFFPSPAYIHSPVRPQKNPRKFTTSSRISRPYPPDPRPPRISPFREVPASNPTPEKDLNYAGIRRRVDLARRREIRSKPKENGAASGRKSEVTGVSGTKPDSSCILAEKESSSRNVIGYSCRGLKIRWKTAILAAILITLFSSLLHRNFSLQNQVNELQDHHPRRWETRCVQYKLGSHWQVVEPQLHDARCSLQMS